jgi:hypothetical protein
VKAIRRSVAVAGGALVAVGEQGGRGFVIKTRSNPLVITAAHCLPALPVPHPWAEESRVWRALAPIGEKDRSLKTETGATLDEVDRIGLTSWRRSNTTVIMKRDEVAPLPVPYQEKKNLSRFRPLLRAAKNPSSALVIIQCTEQYAECSCAQGMPETLLYHGLC